MKAQEIIRMLDLEPLEFEGGYFRETFRAGRVVAGRNVSTAIYYLLTPETCSRLRRLVYDEVFHFYLGDPVEQIRLRPDGAGEVVILGTGLAAGERPQSVVPGGVWQGARLKPDGPQGFALLGATMAPGFDLRDFEIGDAGELAGRYPDWNEWIRRLAG